MSTEDAAVRSRGKALLKRPGFRKVTTGKQSIRYLPEKIFG